VNLYAVFDPLFRYPFLTGALFALLLPVLGMYLRLREEWLAALAFAQVSAAGSLAGAVLGIPFQLAALAAACLAAAGKGWLARTGNNGYAVLMLFGWATAILLLANVPIAEHLAHALFDGQLYFTSLEHLLTAIVFTLLTAALLRWLSRPLLLERMLPDFFRASGQSPRRYHLAFDLLAASGLALATASMGVMAAFGLVFVPSMIAYQLGRSWSRSLLLAVAVSLAAYLLAFASALALDQPFGPVLVSVLVLLACAGLLLRLWRTAGREAASGR
jgi:zinc transport system permease protein